LDLELYLAVEIIVPHQNVPIFINYTNSMFQICTNTDESKSILKKIIESRVGACHYAFQFFSGPPSYGSWKCDHPRIDYALYQFRKIRMK
jgi:hypothetical protein